MVGDAADLDLGPRNTLDRLDDADVDSFVVEYRPLFDMQFDIGVRRLRRHRRVSGVADAGEILAYAGAVDASCLQDIFQRQHPGEHQATHHVGRKARALLICEKGRRQRVLGLDTRLVERFDDFQRGQHAQIAVEAAPSTYRVDV